jgi:Putative amidoligase enzyme
MNPLIKGRLPTDYQLLWQLTKKQRLSGDLAAMIQNQVKQVRKNFRNTKRDPLTEKYLNFGNEGLWSQNKLRELSHMLYEPKKPDSVNVGAWISVEIECIMPNEDAETNFIKFIRKHDLTKFITIKTDGSLRTISPQRQDRNEEQRQREEAGTQFIGRMRNPPVTGTLRAEQERTRTAYGREIIMTFQYGDWKFVNMVCGELNRVKCYVNSSCGLHVHFDCRHLRAEDVLRIGKRVAHSVPALKQILPPSRQANRFCARDINEFQGRNEDRYSFVNLQAFQRHGTIEIRGHGGTCDPVKIVNWIRILKKIMDKRSRKTIGTVSELINMYKLDQDLIEYMNARYEKFHKPNVPTEETVHLDDIEVDSIALEAVTQEMLESRPIAVGQTDTVTIPTNTDTAAIMTQLARDAETGSPELRQLLMDTQQAIADAMDIYHHQMPDPVNQFVGPNPDDDDEEVPF